MNEMRALCSLGEADVEATPDDGVGLTALHLAAQKGHRDAVRTLIVLGSNPAATSKRGRTALHLACSDQADAGVVRALTETAPGTIDARDETGWTALHWACSKTHTESMRVLLSAGADARATTEDGTTALHWASRLGDAQAIELLHSHGADVSARAADGARPLHWAASHGQPNAARLLLSKGAEAGAADGQGRTAAELAAEALGRARAGTEAKDGAEKTVAEPEKVRRLEQVVAELQLHS